MNITPMQMITAELGGLYGSAVLEDIGKTIRLYEFYDGKGQDWTVASGLDYKPSKKRVNLVKKLIKREAGFMFGRTPEINLRSDNLAGCVRAGTGRVGRLGEEHERARRVGDARIDIFRGSV